MLVNQGRALVDYFLEAADACGDGKAACNWVTQDVLRVLKESEGTIEDFTLSAKSLGGLVAAIKKGDVPGPRAREVFDLMLAKSLDLKAAVGELGIEAVDDSELEGLCRELIAANPRIADDVRGGKQQAVGALIGQAKKKNPNVDRPGRCASRFRAISCQLYAFSYRSEMKHHCSQDPIMDGA